MANGTSQLAVGADTEAFNPAIGLNEEADLWQVFRTVRRRKWVVIAAVVVLMGLAALYVRQLVPQYAAETLILIEGRGAEIVSFEAVVGGLAIDNKTIRNEIQVLRSRELAQNVVNRLFLDSNPEFNVSLRQEQPSKLSVLRSKISEWLAAMVGSDEQELPKELSTKQPPGKEQADIIDGFLSRLDIFAKEESRAIAVVFTSENPSTSALVANTLAELYILEQREAKFEGTRQAAAWLSERVASVQDKVEASERAVEKFRQESGLLGGSRGEPLVAQQISEMNTESIQATTALVEAESRLQQVNKLRNSPADIESATDVLQSPVIQQLRQQQVELELQMAELSKRYSVEHPDMVRLGIRAADLQSAIVSEVKKITQRLRNEVGIATARQASLQQSLEGFKQQSAEANTATVELRALEREAEANRQLLKALISRSKETSSQDDIDLHQADARIISHANIPAYPIPSRKIVIIAVTLLGSTCIGVLLVFLLEGRQTGFQSGLQIEQSMGMQALGMIPRLSWADKTRTGAVSHLLRYPHSAFAESIRSLHTSLLLSQYPVPPKKILFVSAQEGEGKTTTAASLARIQALAGQKVVLVDADTRSPAVHRTFNMPREPGLVELVEGQALLEEVVRTDEDSGLSVIPAGSRAANPPTLLASEQMDRVLDKLAKTYDLIILDSPPLMPVSDARILSTKADATVFVLRWTSTKREVASVALKQLVTGGGRVAGILLSMVDVKKNALYGYGDSGLYGRSKYYAA